GICARRDAEARRGRPSSLSLLPSVQSRARAVSGCLAPLTDTAELVAGPRWDGATVNAFAAFCSNVAWSGLSAILMGASLGSGAQPQAGMICTFGASASAAHFDLRLAPDLQGSGCYACPA